MAETEHLCRFLTTIIHSRFKLCVSWRNCFLEEIWEHHGQVKMCDEDTLKDVNSCLPVPLVTTYLSFSFLAACFKDVKCLFPDVRKRQFTSLKHIMRREKLKYVMTTGKLHGKRGTERQRSLSTLVIRSIILKYGRLHCIFTSYLPAHGICYHNH